VIYDAEDQPEPNQLLRALARFEDEDERLACVQARLTIDNAADSWLTRLFTAEYCGLFDVFLPALSAWRVPLPLGGSSNHFRTRALRDVGGWDPYNVTEDADLGMRLARYGFVTAMISSTTYEEAPGELDPWLRQRSRWFKGWIQTWLVHMRTPCALYRELGCRGFLIFQLVVGGTVLAALIHPVFVAALILKLAFAGNFGLHAGKFELLLATLSSATFVVGYAGSAILAFIGLGRRKLLKYATILSLVPVLWLLLSLAAWRGMIQFLCDPYRWEKTEHGLGRSSRLL
jgi:cellulose synthase/poly-beta-1,6-N-acetylglucosamine synthase-like glycosyltransferase